MKEKINSIKKAISKILVSVFIVAVFIVPVLLTGRWAIGLVNSRDHRKVVAVQTLQVRSADKTNAPLRPLSQPLISISFDDGWESVYTQALPVLQRDGFSTTQFVISGIFSNRSYMSVAQLKSMQAAGHEIGDHTVDHADLTTLDQQQLTKELVDSRTQLQNDFGPVKDFTSPYGAYNAYTLQQIGLYFRSQKNAEGDPAANTLEAINTTGHFDRMNFVSYSVRNTTTMDDLKKLVNAAQQNNAWLVLTYHQVDYSGETFSVTPEAFKQQMDYLSRTNIRSATIGQVMDALAPDWKAAR